MNRYSEGSLAPPGPPRGAFASALVGGRGGGGGGGGFYARGRGGGGGGGGGKGNDGDTAAASSSKSSSSSSSSSSSLLPLTPLSASIYGMFDAHVLAARLHSSPYLRLMCEDTESLPRWGMVSELNSG